MTDRTREDFGHQEGRLHPMLATHGLQQHSHGCQLFLTCTELSFRGGRRRVPGSEVSQMIGHVSGDLIREVFPRLLYHMRGQMLLHMRGDRGVDSGRCQVAIGHLFAGPMPLAILLIRSGRGLFRSGGTARGRNHFNIVCDDLDLIGGKQALRWWASRLGEIPPADSVACRSPLSGTLRVPGSRENLVPVS